MQAVFPLAPTTGNAEDQFTGARFDRETVSVLCSHDLRVYLFAHKNYVTSIFAYNNTHKSTTNLQ